VEQPRVIRLAQASHRLDKGVKHCLQVESRAADDLEHVGGSGLLLQRFAQLVEQSGVLDGDDRLGGEILDQLDLLVGEGADLLAVDADSPDQLLILQHRDAENGPSAREVDKIGGIRSTEKSWPHFRPSPVDFCSSRLAIGAASERARALAMPAGTRAQALQTRTTSSGVVPASSQVAYRALLERAGSREPADRRGIDGIGPPRHIGLRLAGNEAL